ncbi:MULTISPECIES: aldehyde dehydrogenase [Rhodococcus]|uniref:Aldehyde dehydrogenase n=1 Tax=Rhodococcus wratislaviensis TaxID=44752 RepID=A0AB38FE80_RHOWR|nr:MULTISPECIES: aldehyde dehydrogenase [Rhodococcus]EJI98979.1 aldehyde dehydrogenase family protein [Rhodococcus sp. JVH1]REE75053.1 acyl-CoA reductase-like NAD-dependent aldehyde dehydrogenase [Rhodococcus wratislaviensis]SPZ39922.1 aldehyde dehydrogenase [Rhodococcus wratislaviensis]
MTTNNNAFFIGGEWHAPTSSDVITVVSPNDEQVVGHAPDGAEADMDAAVDAARQAFDDPTGWSQWEPSRRAAALKRLADALDKRAPQMVQAVSSQNGMPVAVAEKLEAVFPQILLRYYAGLIENDGFEETRPGLLGGSTLVTKAPIGVVGAIVPWNFPQALAAFKYAPALAAGCTIVIKPSPETVLDSYVLAEAIEEADLPAGVINIVPGGRELGAYLVSHPGIDKVAFTGSSAAGRNIAEACGRLLRPVTLELGGKSAAIILDDANLDLATVGEQLFGATMLNNGQVCYLGTRVLAPQSRYQEVVDTFSALAGSLTVGSSLDPATMIGPMASARQRDRVESYIAKGKGDGARITVGGGRPEGLEKGWFVEPTIFADVDNNYTIAQEEIFGPVLSIISYRDDEEAVRIANDSDFGLGGTVFTADHDHGVAVARRVQTGTIGINGYLPDPTAPFGGVKASGLGRELGPEALSAYLVQKSIYL